MSSYPNSSGRLSYECAVIGAGPAGLTGALYLARFRRSVIVFDGGRSRAQWIPESNNCPGFPGGVSGITLLDKQRAQLSIYDAQISNVRIERVEKCNAGFLLVGDDGSRLSAHKVLLATGIVDVLPDADWVERAIQLGALRLCPVCDGFEVSDKRIAVYGAGASAFDHAAFLRTYSADVTLICSDGKPLDGAKAERAASLGVHIVLHHRRLHFDGSRCSIETADGTLERFDSVYAFLGCHAQSNLAEVLGAETDQRGALRVDHDQMTSVEGLYAAGDVVSSLHQIAVAVGHSGIAATAMHNALALNPRQGVRRFAELAGGSST